jgi:hypothetical protein
MSRRFKSRATAEEIIDLMADALRKRDPSLTPEMAYSRIYCAPESLHLRRPAVTGDPIAKQAAAIDELESIAKGLRVSYAAKTDAQLLEMATTLQPDILKRERVASRAALGVEV